MFLIDKSGSMEGAIEKSKEALVKILAGFPPEKLHIAAFDTHGHGAAPEGADRASASSTCSRRSKAGGGTHALVGARRRSGARASRSPRERS